MLWSGIVLYPSQDTWEGIFMLMLQQFSAAADSELMLEDRDTDHAASLPPSYWLS
jgi:hypothetical protein